MVKAATKPRVFGIGFGRTGTTSLGDALNKLGIRTIHFPCDPTTQHEIARGDGELSVLRQYDGIVDTPVIPIYKQVDLRYPNSKFILTVRNMETWLESMSMLFQTLSSGRWSLDEATREFIDFINKRVYGTTEFDRYKLITSFKSHEHDVLEYFRHRPDDLLVMDIVGGDGWERLCTFLGLPVPNEPFPAKNDKKALREGLEKLTACRQDLQSLFGAGCGLVIVDHGVLGYVAGWGLKRLNLLEWGLPASDEEAIHAVEQWRASGASHIVFAWPAFWWFDYYTGFTEHLNTAYVCQLRNDHVVVFRMA